MNDHAEIPGSIIRAACWLCGAEDRDAFLGPRARRLERCRRCGLLFRAVGDLCGDSSIEPDVVSARLPLHRALLREIEAQSRPPGRLLDVGCGSGDFLALARDRGWEVEGVETGGRAADRARARGLKIVHGVLGEARLPERSFDVVTLWEVLDWMETPLSDLGEIARLLKGGGALFLRVRNGPVHVAIWKLGRRLSLKALGDLAVVHRHGFSARTLRRTLELAGFERVRVSNSRLARGAAYYRRLSRASRTAAELARLGWTVLTGALRVLSAGRILAGASLVARCRKPDPRPGRDAP